MTVTITSEEIPVGQIKIGKRLRREIGNVESLCNSIKSIGLINPITITHDNYLVSGQRRLEAVKKIGWKTVPVRRLSVMYGGDVSV